LRLISWVSRTFPETAWRVMNHYQAIHMFYAGFGFLKRKRLTTHP